MKKVLNILFALIPFIGVSQINKQINSDAFVLKADATGLERNYKTDLSPIAIEIATLLNKPNDFKVFDYGLYLNNTQIITGVDELLAKIKKKSDMDSPYYLTITKIFSSKNAVDSFDVKLKLPISDSSLCLNDTKVALIAQRISLKINATYKKKTVLNFGTAIEQGLIELKITLQTIKKGKCCPVTEQEIKDMLLSEGFIGVPIGKITDATNNFNLYDYALVNYNGDNIAKILNQVTSGFSTTENYRTYVTDNDNICSDNYYQLTKEQYNINLGDFDVWFHVFKGANGNNMLFCKCEQYFWADKEYESVPTSSAKPEKGSIVINEQYFVFDPSKQQCYLSSKIAPLPYSQVDDDIPDPPIHIVIAGQTFSSIEELYEYEFTVSDLERWNPKVDGKKLQVGQRLLLFVEDYAEEIKQCTYGINIPLIPQNGKWDPFNGPKISTKDIREQLTKKGCTKAEVDAFTGRLSIVKDIHIPNELKDFKPVDERLALPNGEWKEVFEVPEDVSIIRKGATFIKYNPIILAAVLVFIPVATSNSDQPMKNLELVRFVNGHDNPLPKVFADPRVDDDALNGKLKYVTYTKFLPNFAHYNTNLKNGRVYVGRSRGFGAPCEIVKNRDYGHKKLKEEKYDKARLDSYVYATKDLEERYIDPSYWFVRGRENKLIKILGGPLGKGSKLGNTDKTKPKNEYTRSRNKIWGISKEIGGKSVDFVEILSLLHPVQPDGNWDGVSIDVCQQ